MFMNRYNDILKIIWVFLTLILLHPINLNAQTIIGGVISQDRELTLSESPYLANENIIVDNGVTLTIQPGVVIQFEHQVQLLCKGNFIAEGTANKPIIFYSSDTISNSFWKGIILDFSLNNGTAKIKNLNISNASTAIHLTNTDFLLIDSVNLKNCKYGIQFLGSNNNTVSNSTISKCTYGLLFIGDQNSLNNEIKKNKFYKCEDVGIFINSFPAFVQNTIIDSNLFNGCNKAVSLGNHGMSGVALHKLTNNKFLNCHNALRVFHDSCTIKNNYFVKNIVGITVNRASHNFISNNIISYSNTGLVLYDNSNNNKITETGFYYNYLAISAENETKSTSGNKNQISNNTFFKNQPIGSFTIYESSLVDSITHNNIVDNGDYCSFLYFDNEIFYAKFNFWNTTIYRTVDSIIYDQQDNPDVGRVEYNPVYTSEVTSSPILPPLKSSMQWMDDKMKISFTKSNARDFSHYKLYWGKNDLIDFENSMILTSDSTFFLTDVNPQDTVAITCVDTCATGNADQLKGYESYYLLPIPLPYAGKDTILCADLGYYHLKSAYTFGNDYITWETDGSGTFDNPNIRNPRYFYSSDDIQRRSVNLYLSTYISGNKYTDTITIKLYPSAQIYIPTDTVASSNIPFVMQTVKASNYLSVTWTTLGDGYFSNPNVLKARYYPGTADAANGYTILNCHLVTACDTVSADIHVALRPIYSISGTIDADNVYDRTISLDVYCLQNTKYERVRSAIFYDSDKNFKLENLFEGEYLLYAKTDTETYDVFPAYFFNRISWSESDVINLNADYYDVDLIYRKPDLVLINGEGSINGNVSLATGVQNQMISIFLTDTSRQNVFMHTYCNDSAFKFNNLPFGSYRLRCEILNYPTTYSDIIYVTPQNPSVANVSIHVSEGKSSFIKSQKANYLVSDIQIYPNPVTDGFKIYGIYAGQIPTKCAIYNANGLKVKTVEIVDTNDEISIKELNAGLYLAVFLDNDTVLQTLRFIKK